MESINLKYDSPIKKFENTQERYFSCFQRPHTFEYSRIINIIDWSIYYRKH